MSNERVLSRSQIEHRIAQGDAIVIYKDQVLKLNTWLKYHPGGDKAVHHLVGRDATDEMIAYHCEATQQTFAKWKIGKIDHKWENFLPPIQGGKFKALEDQEAQRITGVEDGSDGFCTSTSTSTSTEGISLDSSTNPSDTDEIDPKVKLKALNNDKYHLKSKDELKLAGESRAEITPVTPYGVIPSLDTRELYEKKVIVDPSDSVAEYDRKLTEKDIRGLPALDPETQEYLSQEYNQLHQEIIDGGYYQCDYWAYFREFVRIGTLFTTSFILLYYRRYFLSAVAIGFAWQQLVFIAHDAGHISITHHYQADNIIGMVVASFIGGLSLGWWKRNHNVHHLVTNDPVHDPDIQHLPFFAVSTRLFGNVYSTYYEKFLWFDKFAQKVIPIQNYMYYPILCFGRFNLYRLSWEYVLMGQGPRHGEAAWFRYFELCGLTVFQYWFFYLIVYRSIDTPGNRLMYVLVSHITTMIVHVQITLSHFAMSTSDLGVTESFVSRQMRTTMDVDCPEWFDYFHGGLQFQAIHHLFPRVPRHNFRKIQPLVIKFCEKVGLKYTIYGFVDGNVHVINKLGEIAKQAKILQACTAKMKEDAIKDGKYFDY